MVLPIKGHGAVHQDVQKDTQGPAVHLGGEEREKEGQQGCLDVTGWRASSNPREERGTLWRAQGAGASKDHLPLGPRSKDGDVVEGLKFKKKGVVHRLPIGGAATDESVVRSSLPGRMGWWRESAPLQGSWTDARKE